MAQRRSHKTLDPNLAPIQAAAIRSGVHANTIRAWEQRHQAVAPQRSDTGRRLYSEADIKRLALLRRATESGYRIGNIAGRTTAKLGELVEKSRRERRQAEESLERPRTDSVMEHFDRCMSALMKLDTSALQETLSRATRELSPPFFLEDLLTPLIHHVRGECYRGTFGNSHLRVFQAIVSSYLLLLNARVDTAVPPEIIICSLKRDNELYALRASAAINANGFPSIYLGDQATAKDVIEAYDTSGARIVVLCSDGINESVRVPNNVRDLHRKIESEHLLFLHSEASAYTQVADELGIAKVHDFADLVAHLRAVFASK